MVHGARRVEVMTATDEPTASGARRSTLSFTGDVGAVVDELTVRRELTLTALVRRALRTYKCIDDAALRGARVLIEEPNGDVKELVFIL